jgi:hypothetical protein
LSNHASETHSFFIERYFFNDFPLLKSLRLSGRFYRKPDRQIQLYHGSQWWALTSDAITFILAFVRGDPGFIRAFRYMNCPDEIFFISVLKTSSTLSKRILQDFERDGIDTGNVFGAHYIDWKNGSADGRSPKTLRMEDVDALKRSGALFARKFREKVSNDLLEYIDGIFLKEHRE